VGRFPASTAWRFPVEARLVATGFVGGGIEVFRRARGGGFSLCVGSSERFFPTVRP
jgi:hypothetical protein